MFCPNCGTDNLDDSAFCEKCGTPLTKQQSAPSAPPVSPAPSVPPQQQYQQPPQTAQQYRQPVMQEAQKPKNFVTIACVVALVLIAILWFTMRGTVLAMVGTAVLVIALVVIIVLNNRRNSN